MLNKQCDQHMVLLAMRISAQRPLTTFTWLSVAVAFRSTCHHLPLFSDGCALRAVLKTKHLWLDQPSLHVIVWYGVVFDVSAKCIDFLSGDVVQLNLLTTQTHEDEVEAINEERAVGFGGEGPTT